MMLKGDNKVVIRPLKKQDLQVTQELRNDRTIIEYAMMHPFVLSDGFEEVWYQTIVNNKNNRNIFFAVENRLAMK